MEFAGKLRFLLLVSIGYKSVTKINTASAASSAEIDSSFQSLSCGFYDDSCPSAQSIVRSTVEELYASNPSVAPAILRLVFNDCFVQGCDASILLDGENGVEKTAPPNQMIRGFDVIDIIKSRVEKACPGVVSCADIIVLAAREGAHSVGRISCTFFMNRLQTFSGIGEPDPATDPQFLDHLRKTCKSSNNASLPELEMQMDYKGPKIGFGTLYYQNLLLAADNNMFKREFMLAMIKLSHVQVLTAPMGEIGINC